LIAELSGAAVSVAIIGTVSDRGWNEALYTALIH
jgi:hypothetical protein